MKSEKRMEDREERRVKRWGLMVYYLLFIITILLFLILHFNCPHGLYLIYVIRLPFILEGSGYALMPSSALSVADYMYFDCWACLKLLLLV